MHGTKTFFRQLLTEIYEVSYTLFKLMIPVIIVVKILEELGAIEILSQTLAPLMQWVGLPETMGLVWATTILTNIYAGLLVFVTLNTEAPLTIAQVSVLGAMMLIAHGLPIEAAIAKKAGVHLWVTLITRIGGGLLFGWILHMTYSTADILQTPAQMLWQPELGGDDSLLGWSMAQLKSLAMIQVIIVVLLFTLKLLKLLGIERLMAVLLRPLLKLLGISSEATSLTIVGITLGLAFGGGLLINEARKGHVPARDVFTAIMLLNLLHSLIEDSLLILLIGADFNSIFWGRLVFAMLLIALMSRLMNILSETTFQRFFYRPVA